MTDLDGPAPEPIMSLSHGGSVDRSTGTEPRTLPSAILKADATSLAINAEKDGRLRVRCSSWAETLVVERVQELILRWVEGQLHVFKVPRPA